MDLAVIPGQAAGLSPESRTDAVMTLRDGPTALLVKPASVLGSGLFADAKPRNDPVVHKNTG